MTSIHQVLVACDGRYTSAFIDRLDKCWETALRDAGDRFDLLVPTTKPTTTKKIMAHIRRLARAADLNVSATVSRNGIYATILPTQEEAIG